MILTRKISTPKQLKSDIHSVSIQSIYESLGEDLMPVLAIKFVNNEGYCTLKLPIELNDKLSVIIGQLGKMGGLPAGTHVKLAMLIGFEYNITINNNEIIKITKP